MSSVEFFTSLNLAVKTTTVPPSGRSSRGGNAESRRKKPSSFSSNSLKPTLNSIGVGHGQSTHLSRKSLPQKDGKNEKPEAGVEPAYRSRSRWRARKSHQRAERGHRSENKQTLRDGSGDVVRLVANKSPGQRLSLNRSQ